MIKISSEQRGAALITALLMVAIAAVIAAEIFTRENFLIKRTMTLQVDERLQNAAVVSVMWAEQQMANMNAPHAKTNNVYPIKMPTLLFHGITIDADLEDAQGYFNINSVVNNSGRQAFVRLIQLSQPTVSLAQAKQLTSNVSNWISSSLSNQDDVYYKKNPPYQAAHQKMVSVSELRLVDGITAPLYQALEKNLVALPDSNTPININTVKASVLACLSANMSLSFAQGIVQSITGNPASSIETFEEVYHLKEYPFIFPLTVMSDYFLLKTEIKLNNQSLYLLTLLRRDGRHGSVILWQVRTI